MIPLRIAVADDEPDMQDYFRKILPVLGHEVVAIAKDGPELIEMCLATRPDLLITDIKMPGQDGFAAIARICSEVPMPVIVISGHSGSDHIDRAYAQYVQTYLVKPIKRADLADAIDGAVRLFRGG